ncbi:MAG: HesA/MoeB/ThiF family protein, partial [Bacteroidota bacterium]
MNTERYQRQLVLPDFGVGGQKRLGSSKILIIGAGGLGVPVMQYLAGMGVGSISIMDADTISLSNLQRQVLYGSDDVGKIKVEVAKKKLQQLNPEITISVIPEMLSVENSKSCITDIDVVIDCTDSIEARYLINDACFEAGIPFVYGALYRHEGHVSVFNHEESVSYRDVYPDDSAKVENCNEIGVLGVLPGIIGTYQAMEAVKIITGIGKPLVDKLLVVDALNSEHHVFELAKNPGQNTASAKKQPEEKWIT